MIRDGATEKDQGYRCAGEQALRQRPSWKGSICSFPFETHSEPSAQLSVTRSWTDAGEFPPSWLGQGPRGLGLWSSRSGLSCRPVRDWRLRRGLREISEAVGPSVTWKTVYFASRFSQTEHERARFAFSLASRARALAALSSSGTVWPVPKYRSSGVRPSKAEWGSRVLCSVT